MYFFSLSDVVNCEIRCLKEDAYDIQNEMSYLEHNNCGFRDIYILSSHRSLKKDILFVQTLRENGYTVHCQTEHAASLGTDKIGFKQFLYNNNMPTPEWTSSGSSIYIDDSFVVKTSNSTETQGVNWYNKQGELAENEYCERYTAGEEYSVNVFSKDNSNVIFPVVYKGRTSKDLMPPYKRIRYCGKHDKRLLAYIEQMQTLSKQIATKVNNYGFMEVEFILSDDGRLYIIEINPRISGTLRMSMLSTGKASFDYLVTPIRDGVLDCINTVFEHPYQGKPYYDIDKNIFCTSRATLVANTQSELEDKVGIVSNLANNPIDFSNFTPLYSHLFLGNCESQRLTPQK